MSSGFVNRRDPQQNPLPAPGLGLEINDEARTVLSGLIATACSSVAGCTAAGLSLLRGSGEVETAAATSESARTLDGAQYRAGDGPCLEAIRTRAPVVVEDLTTDPRWPVISDEAKTFHLRSVLSLPVAADGHLFGALNLYAPDPGTFDASTHQPGAAIARQGATSLRYLQLLQAEQAARAREHAVAETLQRGLLPHITGVDGVTAACRYMPSGATAEVGGDWYDLLTLPDGSVGLAIGDVIGHGIGAAAAMGQLRGVLCSSAWEGHTPAAVLDRLDHLVQKLGMAQLATAVHARLTLDPDGSARLRYANAGHPPPLVHQPDGTVRLLEHGHSLLIGAPVTRAAPRPEATETLPTGSTLLFYTDGLLENRHRDLDEGLALLRDTAARHHPDNGPDALCDMTIDTFASASSADDVAVLAVQIPNSTVRISR